MVQHAQTTVARRRHSPGERPCQRLVDQGQPLRDPSGGDQAPAQVGPRGQLQIDVTGLPPRVDAAAHQRARLVGVGDHEGPHQADPALQLGAGEGLGPGEPAGRGGTVAEVDQMDDARLDRRGGRRGVLPGAAEPHERPLAVDERGLRLAEPPQRLGQPVVRPRQVRRRQHRLERRPRLGPPAVGERGRPGVEDRLGHPAIMRPEMGRSTDVRPGDGAHHRPHDHAHHACGNLPGLPRDRRDLRGGLRAVAVRRRRPAAGRVHRDRARPERARRRLRHRHRRPHGRRPGRDRHRPGPQRGHADRRPAPASGPHAGGRATPPRCPSRTPRSTSRCASRR